MTVSMNGHLIADDLNIIKDLVLAGEGIALLPTFLCELETKKNRLIRILPDWHSDVRPINFVYPPQKFVNPKLKAFMEIATEHLKARLKDNEI
ncbi:MAG: LysR substrate-binding domain-containing protein [Bdellovibrio sp.]